MIRRLIRRLLGGPDGDIYIVRDYFTIVGVSTRMQGAERIRAEYAARRADLIVPDNPKTRELMRQRFYDRTEIENHELQDVD